MKSKYGAIAGRARSQVRAKGVPVTFIGITPGTYDDATGRETGELTVELPGYAVRIDGDPDRYLALSLIQSQAPTLLFAPATFGRVPEPGMTVRFAGATYTVRDVDPVGPDGVAIIARIVVSGGGRIAFRSDVDLEIPAIELSAEMEQLFAGEGQFIIEALALEASGDNGVPVAYGVGDSLAGATFSRSTTATFTEEIPDQFQTYSPGDSFGGATVARSSTASYVAEV